MKRVRRILPAVLCLIGTLFRPIDNSHAAPQKAPSKHVSAAEAQSGIIYGPKFAFGIAAPKGWIMDIQAGRDQGTNAVFYRRGESWQRGQAVLYIVVNEQKKSESLQGAANRDLAVFKSESPRMTIHKEAPLKTSDGRPALTYTLAGVSAGAAKERVSYFSVPGHVITVVLTAKTLQGYNAAVRPHAALIASFFYMTRAIKRR